MYPFNLLINYNKKMFCMPLFLNMKKKRKNSKDGRLKLGTLLVFSISWYSFEQLIVNDWKK